MDGTRQHDLYDVLGVRPEASEDAIRQAYRSLARRHHPDLNPGADDDAFQRVAAAYGVLGDRRRRRAYDRLRPPRSTGPTAQRRAPAPTGNVGPFRPPDVDVPASPPSAPTDEWRILSWVGGMLVAAVVLAAIVIVGASLVLGGDGDGDVMYTLPGPAIDTVCQTPDGWVDCRMLYP
jgi:hypothetical protein